MNKTKTMLEVILLLSTLSLIAVLVVWPGGLKAWCERGEFDECIFFGSKYELSKRQQKLIQKTAQEFGESEAELNSAGKFIKRMSAELEKLEGDPELIEDANSLISAIEKNLEARQGELGNINDVVTELAPTGDWAVVAGATSTVERAIEDASKLDSVFPATIYFRKGFYRIVVNSSSRSLAKNRLEELRNLPGREDSYIVNLSTWCTSPKEISDNDLEIYECGQS